MKIDPTLKTLIKAARAGGDALLTYFGKELKHSQKSAHQGDYQTEADLTSEKIILEILQKELPDYNIFSEEYGLIDKKSEYAITVDPLDGTHQFLLEIPHFGTLLSLRKGDIVQYGVIYEPILNRITFAQKNKGAYQQTGNNPPIKLSVNKIKSIQKSTIYLIVAFQTLRRTIRRLQNSLFDANVKRILRPWTALVFTQLASGKIEGAVSSDTELHDILAGKLICAEAGAQITHFGENIDTNPNFVLSNPQIHKKLVEIVKPIFKKNHDHRRRI